MEILVNLDVMMAKRKISAGELAERAAQQVGKVQQLRKLRQAAAEGRAVNAVKRRAAAQEEDLRARAVLAFHAVFVHDAVKEHRAVLFKHRPHGLFRKKPLSHTKPHRQVVRHRVRVAS